MSGTLRNLTLCLGLLAAASPATRAQSADAAPAVSAQPQGDTLPDELRGKVGITPRADAGLPLDARFMDDAGREVVLGDYFQGEKPVLLNLVYFRCPSLCSAVLNEVTACLREMEWEPGEQFEVVTVSINPHETANLAREKKANYLEALGRPQAAAGWHFLSGSEPNIQAVADAVGFGFEFDTMSREYAHGAGIFICTPDGRLSRTITGLSYEARTVKFSLLEAADGKVGSPLDQVLLYCYHFDPDTGVYTAQVMNIMRLAGLLTVTILGLFVGGLFWRERRSQAVPELTPSSPASPRSADA